MKKFQWIFSVFLISMQVNSQNLVYNGSAEILKDCEIGLGSVFKAVGWITPNQGSSDVLNVCSTSEYVKVPRNLYGFQHPKHGNGYFGIGISYDVNDGRERYEYLHSQLSSTLEKDTVYEVSFYVSPSDRAGSCYVDRIGALFTDTVMLYYPSVTPIPLFRIEGEPQIESEAGKLLSDTTGWTLVKDTFRATGTEEYITIGFFRHFNDMTVVAKPYNTDPPNGFYTYVDSIVVKKWTPPVEVTLEVPNVFTPNGNQLDDYYFIRSENIEELNVEIYNRWGVEVFASNDVDFRWDGTKDGNDLAEGVYYILVQAKDAYGNQMTEKRSITLIR
ncbi:MAG: gliding motility-associated C-terminal domain-containing protein [Schleiferiaceae bacterium]|jgi:gliding motility-associated-like protein|nr:gliding motility-associated C-terminal domain-containing protein [Schleiferiaceae bacterium]